MPYEATIEFWVPKLQVWALPETPRNIIIIDKITEEKKVPSNNPKIRHQAEVIFNILMTPIKIQKLMTSSPEKKCT